MQAAEEFSTLVHEIAHEMLRRSHRRTLTTKQIRETEAEAVARWRNQMAITLTENRPDLRPRVKTRNRDDSPFMISAGTLTCSGP